MADPIRLTAPLTDADIEQLTAGDRVLISGVVYTARDAAHARLVDLVVEDKELPFDVAGQIIYFVGPTPAPEGRPIGSAGPTTSYRMDPYSPTMLDQGLKAMIGKGKRSDEVKDALRRNKAAYLAATGGAGALISQRIQSAEIVAYEDLGPEAIRKLVVEDFPAVVVNDCKGGDLYADGRKQYAKTA